MIDSHGPLSSGGFLVRALRDIPFCGGRSLTLIAKPGPATAASENYFGPKATCFALVSLESSREGEGGNKIFGVECVRL